MSAAAGRLELSAWKIRWFGVYAVIGVSTAFVVLDAVAGILGGRRTDLAIELLARTLMLVLAVLAARETKGDRRLRLLLWAVVLISFDTYWQSTYRYVGGKPVEWLEMCVKYAAVPGGLALLLRLCTLFGNGEPDRVRGWLDRYAPALGAVLAVIGLVHGALYAQSCHFFVGDQCLVSRAALVSLDVYLVADALLRLAIVAAAAISYVRASRAYKQRTLLALSASVVFALGTAVHFLARLYVGYDAAVLLAIGDAVTTLLFPLALLYASTRGRLFDVEYTVRRVVSAVLAALIVFAVWEAAGTSTFAVMFAFACSVFGLLTFAQKALLSVLFWLAARGFFLPRAVGFVFVLLGLGKLAGMHLFVTAPGVGWKALAAARWAAVTATPATMERYRGLIEFSKREKKTALVYLATAALALIELIFHESTLNVSRGMIHMPEKIARYDAAAIVVGFTFLLTWLAVHAVIEPGTAWFFPERPKRIRRLKRITENLWDGKGENLMKLTSLDELKAVLDRALRDVIWATFAEILELQRDPDSRARRYVSYLCTRDPPLSSLGDPDRELEKVLCALGPAPSKRYDDGACALCADVHLVVSIPGADVRYGLLLCGKPIDERFTFDDEERRAFEAFGAAAGTTLFRLHAEPAKAGSS